MIILLLSNYWIWSRIINKPALKVVFFDVGQGDAAYIEYPNGKNMLIDCGKRGFYRVFAREAIAPYLENRGVKKIDVLALSHPHNDHIGGAPYILKNYEVDEVWQTKVKSRSQTFRQIQKLADSLKVPIEFPFAGDVYRVGDEALVEVLHPSQKFLAESQPNFNNASTALKISYGKNSILFTGDVEQESENYLNLYGKYLNSAVLKVPHHGSATSSTKELIQYTAPQYALISVGAGNKFGHPAQATIQKYKNQACYIHRTDQQGALVLQVYKDKIKKVKWR